MTFSIIISIAQHQLLLVWQLYKNYSSQKYQRRLTLTANKTKKCQIQLTTAPRPLILRPALLYADRDEYGIRRGLDFFSSTGGVFMPLT